MRVTRDTLPFRLPEILEKMIPGKAYELEVKLHREKRSKDANAFLWSLLGKMADILNSTQDDLYLEALKRYGQSFLVKVRSADLEKSMREFKYCEPFEQWSDPMGDAAYIRVFRGSSGYDTKEFSRLLNGVIDEAKELGIDTDSEEIKQMIERWEPVWH